MRSKAVVVNSFYDEATRASFEKLCTEKGCDFINVENKGYGTGNNVGIAHAVAHYGFKYLVVCNPDIIIWRMGSELLERKPSPCIYGPEIMTMTGKRQNPCSVIYGPLRERLMRRFAAHPGNSFPFYLAIAINKFERIIFNLFFSRSTRRVYSLHGSFLIFSAEALSLMGQPFDQRMFLFREEDHIARLSKKLGIEMIYFPKISVMHKEDGSVKFMTEGTRAHTIESLRIYFGLE
jgi:GT2 family glycosyltransferase